MSYATVMQLRDRFTRNGDDEFALREDEELALALTAASSEIDSYRPAGPLSVAAADILREKCLTLARMLAHQDEALDDAHPIVRDAKSVRHWLDLLARKQIELPVDVAPGEPAPSGYAAPVRTLTLGAAFEAAYQV